MSLTKTNVLGVALVALAVAVMLPFTARAADFTNVEFSNGDVTIQGNGGNSVTAKFRVVIGPGEVVEKIQTDVIGDGLAPVCKDVGGSKGLEEGTHSVSMQVKLPPNTGTYDLDVQGSGIFGAFSTVDCTANVVGSASFGGALKVVSGSSNSGGDSNDDSIIPEWFKQFALMMGWNLGGNPTPPAQQTVCQELSAKLIGTQYGVYNDNNVALQGFLLAWNPNAIPALKAGSTVPMGFYGPQTGKAVTDYQMAKGCY